jgi:hypothetical protein
MNMLAALLLAFAAATFQPVTPTMTSQTSDVFVRDASAQAQPGPGGHDFGLRPPGDSDADSTPLYNAHGQPLKAVLGVWRTGDGRADLQPTPRGTRVHATFHHLIPNGRYSLFLRQLAGKTGTVFTPLDVTGAANSFTTDATGYGEIAVTSPLQIPPGTQLVVVYHSDGADHQSSLGNPGVNAHTQLIARLQ